MSPPVLPRRLVLGKRCDAPDDEGGRPPCGASQVNSVIPGGPADVSGKVFAGDTLMTIDATPIDNFPDGMSHASNTVRKAVHAHARSIACVRRRTAQTACTLTLEPGLDLTLDVDSQWN